MKKKKIIFIFLFILLLAGLIVGVVLIGNKPKENDHDQEEKTETLILKNLEIELDEELPKVEDFIEVEGYELFYPEELLEKEILPLGVYEVTLKKDDNILTSKITIKDTKAPELVLKSVTIIEGDSINNIANSFVKSCVDNSKNNCKITITDKDGNETNIDNTIGTHEVYIKALDNSGNKTISSTKLIVNKKKEQTSIAINKNDNPTTNNNITGNKTEEEQLERTNICTPNKPLPEGAVWYKTWDSEGIGLSTYMDWSKTVNDSKMLYDALEEMAPAHNGISFRTDGGKVPVNCQEDGFKVYGVYIVINGYEQYYENDALKEVQTEQGYIKPDGTTTWVYKEF